MNEQLNALLQDAGFLRQAAGLNDTELAQLLAEKGTALSEKELDLLKQNLAGGPASEEQLEQVAGGYRFTQKPYKDTPSMKDVRR